MLAGFKKFILQGNVIDLAVGVVIGVAFGDLVKTFTSAFIKPLIALVSGGGVSGGTFTISGQVFDYAAIINAAITFGITAAVVYFVVVVPMNTVKDRRKSGQEEEVEVTNEERMVELLERIASK